MFNDFPIESKLLSFHQSIPLSLSLSLSLSDLSSPHQNKQLPPFGFKTHWFNFLYIDFESLFEVTKLQLELESLLEVSFSFSSLELLCFSAIIFMVCIAFFPPNKSPNYNQNWKVYLRSVFLFHPFNFFTFLLQFF